MKRAITWALWISVLTTSVATAQSTVALTGVVKDESGGMLAGVTVVVTDKKTGAGTVTVTDSRGAYKVSRTAGEHEVRFVLSGFADVTRTWSGTSAQALDVTMGLAPFSSSTVVVTATRSERALKDVPATLNVITAAEITDKGARYVGDELQSVPGVFVMKNDEGTYTSLIIRGVPEQHHNETFLALLDGVPFVSGNDEVDLEQIPTGAVDHVEVVKGPMSALYGRGSIAGAVNYISKSVPVVKMGEFQLAGGSYGHVKPTLSFGIPVTPNRHYLYASAYGESKNGWRDGSDRKAGNIFLKDHWLLNSSTDLLIYANGHRYRQDVASHLPLRADGSVVNVTGGTKANYNIEDSNYKKTLGLVSAVLRRTVSDGVAWRTTAHYRFVDSSSNLGFNEGFDETTRTISWNGFKGASTQQVVFVEPQITWNRGRARLVVGATLERVSGTSREDWTGQYGFSFVDFNFYFYSQKRNVDTGLFTNRSTWVTNPLLDADYAATVAAGYAQIEAPLGDRVTLTAGGRFDHFSRTVDFLELRATDGVTPASSQKDDDQHFSPKVSLSARLSEAVTAYAAFGEGFNPAFGPVWAFGGRNTNLKPEVARGYEGGVKGDFANGRLSVATAAYRIDRRDLLQLVLDGPGTSTINAGKQRSQGFELDSRFLVRRSGRTTSGYARYAYTDSTWVDNRFVLGFANTEVNLSGKTPTRIPAHQVSLGLTQELPAGWRLTLWSDTAGRYFVTGNNQVTAPGVTVFNASLAANIGPRLSLQVAATNLANKKFFYYYGTSSTPTEAYPALPFQLFATAKIRLGR
jgi:iron complex outermembrane receptor protein